MCLPQEIDTSDKLAARRFDLLAGRIAFRLEKVSSTSSSLLLVRAAASVTPSVPPMEGLSCLFFEEIAADESSRRCESRKSCSHARGD